MHKEVTGVQSMQNRMRAQIRRVSILSRDAVDATVTEAEKHAQANHSDNAHAAGRYRNQTTTLTRNIKSGVVPDRKGFMGFVLANTSYAADVELGSATNRPYPFIFPALQSVRALFKANMGKIV